MRIVHVIAEFSAHEAMGRTVSEIARRVPGEHYVITTTAHDGQDAFAGVVELGGAVETFPIGRRDALNSALADLRPDLVHIHGGALAPLLVARTAIPWYPNLLTMYAWPVLPSMRRLRSGGIRAAMQSNVLRPRVLASSVLPTWLLKRSLRRSGTREVLTPDPRVERKLGAIRVGSGGPQDSRRATYTDEAPVVLFAGRAESVRGIDTLLACFPDVVREVPDARLRLLLIPRPELDALLETGTEVALMEIPCWSPVDGGGLVALPERGDRQRTQHLTELIRQVASTYPDDVAVVTPPAEFCTDESVGDDVNLRWDGVHYGPLGGAFIWARIEQALLEVPVDY